LKAFKTENKKVSRGGSKNAKGRFFHGGGYCPRVNELRGRQEGFKSPGPIRKKLLSSRPLSNAEETRDGALRAWRMAKKSLLKGGLPGRREFLRSAKSEVGGGRRVQNPIFRKLAKKGHHTKTGKGG